jgi:CHAT domain-containing protein/Tfp pilus assembly protein PilF
MPKPIFNCLIHPFKLIVCLMTLVTSLAWAQFDDAIPIKLDPAEAQRLKQIVNADIDPNLLNASKIEIHKKKELAAAALGDSAAREKNLREWMQIDEEGAWILRGYLAGTERRAESYEIGLNIIKTDRRPPAVARMQIFLADAYIEDNELEKANAMLTMATNSLRLNPRFSRTGADVYLHGDTDLLLLIVRSRYLMRIGKLSEAITTAKLAVEKSRAQLATENLTNDRHKFMGRNNALRALYLLSLEQTAAGFYTDSESSLREAYQLAKKFGFNEKQMSGFYGTVADLYNAMGQYKEALNFAQRSEGIVLDIGFLPGSTAWLSTQLRTNMALAGLDRWKDALNNFERIDQLVSDLKLETTMAQQSDVRGMVYLRNQRYAEASQLLEQSLQWSKSHLGPTHHHTALVQGLLASALAGQSQNSLARSHFEQSIQHVTSPEALTGDMTETAYLRKVKRYVLQNYAKLLALTAKSNSSDAETLFKVADQLNTSSVQQALSEAAVRSGVTIPGLADIIRKEQDAKNEIATLTNYIRGQDTVESNKQNPQVISQMRSRLKELETQRKEFKVQIQKGFPEYFQLIQPKAPSHTEIAQQLHPDELFVSIIPMEDQTYVWAIDAQGQFRFHNASLTERDVSSLVDKIRKTLDVAELGPKAPPFDYSSAYILYSNLLSPFDKDIDNKKHLIFSSSGSMAKLPFAVLTRTAFTSNDASNAPWLIRDVALSHVPNASGWVSLKRFSKTPHSTEAMMAWGDPTFDPKAVQQVAATTSNSVVRSSGALRSADLTGRNVLDPDMFINYSRLPTLPETRDEVLELARILSANPSEDVVLGAQATRESVLKSSASGRLSRKQVVVFATHGLLAGDLPNLNQPALAMASTTQQGQSPLLTLEDVLSLKLNADWVVLSACNTAGADGRAEEALSGLARGFFYAGSRSMLVTHWSVESESAMLLTTQTFSAYKKDASMRRSEALRQAMLETMKLQRFAHPTYWAPYALVGEGGR